MRVVRRSMGPAPDAADRSRLTVGIRSDRGAGDLEYWFEFPCDRAAEVSGRDDPIAVLLAPVASFAGEPVYLDGAVDERLLRNLHAASQIWNQWYRECSVVEFVAPNQDEGPAPPAPRSIACFSAGVDSYYTLTRHHGAVRGDGSVAVHDLLTVAGFNSPMSGYDTMREIVGTVVDDYGCRHLPVLTNVRYGDHAFATPYSRTEWMVKLAHGSFLAAIGHLFGSTFSEMLIPGTHGYPEGDAFFPYGSSVLVDRLLSSSGLAVIHEGAAASRLDKVRSIGSDTKALDALHVCWRDWEFGNCSRCHKCLRTMAELDVCGFLGTGAFEWDRYSMDALAGLVIPKDTIPYFHDLRRAAQHAGRVDLAHAVQRAIRRSPIRGPVRVAKRRIRSLVRQ